MTTIVGLEADYRGSPVIVLASDLTSTNEREVDRGEVIFRVKTQGDYTKMYAKPDGRAIIAIAGVADDATAGLLERIMGREIDLDEVVHKKFLTSLRDVNLDRSHGRLLPPEETTSFLLAYAGQDNIPRLYTCWPLGLVEPRRGTAIGSGSDYALEFINRELACEEPIRDLLKSRERKIGARRAIELAMGAVRHSAQDIYTKGLDLKILTSSDVKSYGDKIRGALRKAEMDVSEGIMGEYPL